MSDPIGYLVLYGDHAQKLFNKTSPGDTLTVRVRGTVQTMQIPNRPMGYSGMVQNVPYGGGQPLASISIEIEGVDP